MWHKLIIAFATVATIASVGVPTSASTRRPSDVLDNFFSRFLRWSGLLSHLRSYERYDEPETLPYSIRPFCPMSADVRQRRPLDTTWIRVRRHNVRVTLLR
jgi:hypothetical protein